MKPLYFAPLGDNPPLAEQVAALKKILNAAGYENLIEPRDFVAIKTHIGEKNNTTHVKPELIKAIVEASRVKTGNVFLTETSTLYKGERANAVNHILHAQRHGFGIDQVGAPFIPADGLTGGAEIEVTINGELERSVKIAREIALVDVLVAVSHPTGHGGTGLGACLKNLGMGLASRAGKLRQHSSIKPRVMPGQCRFCKKCVKWCPEQAIVESNQKAKVLLEKCIGCGECFTVCRYDAIEYNWGIGSERLQKSMAEHAYGAIKDKMNKCLFINVLIDMTLDCDCVNINQTKFIPDVGILASRDPVAVDKATLDLTAKANPGNLSEMAYPNLNPLIQLQHGVKIGMGEMEYRLIQV
jgi:uncharacterized Fe-S center protein